MDMNLTAIEDVAGTCERILRTPIPLSYTRHTSRFMILWLSALPFALWEPLQWGMVPSCLVISLLTLGVEDIGVLIEEPFSILPLEQICSTIRVNIEELVEIQEAESNKHGENGAGGEDEDVFRKVSASELVRRAKLEGNLVGGSGGGSENF
jgi:predicted membrane chloride channel (bestrophin family)